MDLCPHDVHRDAWTPLRERVRIVDRVAVLGRLALRFAVARVDRAVELVGLKLALDVVA